MMMKSKVAVIIPAFNAEKTISRTIESILAQTLKQLELWIVDDGSSDGTNDLIIKYAQTDNRVHVLNKENGGAYSARRYAMRFINAEYVGFVDADDEVEPTMYELMYNFAQKEGLDVVKCDVFGSLPKEKTNDIFRGKQSIYDNVIKPMIIEGSMNCTVWNHIYRVNKDFSLDESSIMMADDMMMNMQFLKDIESYGSLHIGLYHYLVNEGSSVRNYRLKNVYDFQEIIEYRKNNLKLFFNADPHSYEEYNWIILNAFNNLYSASVAQSKSWKQRMKNINTILRIKPIENATLYRYDRKKPIHLTTIKLFYTPLKPFIVLYFNLRNKLNRI